jgi:hypothetical protein
VILDKAVSDNARPQAHFNRLDEIFKEQDRVMNEAMSKMFA